MASPEAVRQVQLGEATKFLASVSTLSSGSIVVIATFADKFAGRGPAALLAISVVCLALTIITGLFAWWLLITLMGNPPAAEVGAVAIVTLVACAVAFAIGLASLAVYAAFAVT